MFRMEKAFFLAHNFPSQVSLPTAKMKHRHIASTGIHSMSSTFLKSMILTNIGRPQSSSIHKISGTLFKHHLVEYIIFLLRKMNGIAKYIINGSNYVDFLFEDVIQENVVPNKCEDTFKPFQSDFH
jgi:hypothetical protein